MSRYARYLTGDPSLMRQLNLAVVMHYLREHAPVYRAQLAEMTGLNKTTVSSLIRELIAQKFVHEAGPRVNGSTGRPAVLLELNPAAGCAIAAEVGVDFLMVEVANFAAEVVWHKTETMSANQDQQAILDRLLILLRSAIAQGLAVTDRVLGIAAGVPGLVDQHSGRLLFAPNLGWVDVPLGDLLRQAFPGPIFLDNEANLAALGEVQFGAAQGYRDVIYVSASRGLGGGIVRDGQLCRGSMGFAGEFGHMTIDPAGALCRCGNRGCWESRASELSLFNLIQQALKAGRPSLLATDAQDDKTPCTVSQVVDAAAAGDVVALESLRLVGRELGIGIASLVNAFNPELVVLGGTLSLASEFLLPEIESELVRRALRWSREAVQLAVAQHRLAACVMGGIATVLQSVLTESGTVSVSRDVSGIHYERR